MTQLQIDHIGVWVRDLELMRDFYVVLGGQAGSLYENPRTGFRSYFVSFGQGPRIELMSLAAGVVPAIRQSTSGYAHVALQVGSNRAVDELVSRLEAAGVVVSGRPRVTGDGYYEATVDDPEGNRIELVGDRRSLTSGSS